MADQEQGPEVPEGAAVFPDIPEELGINPLLLAALHGMVFLSGSSEEVVHPAAADEALDRMATYLGRLEGPRLQQAREDIDVLVRFARQEKWPKAMVRAVRELFEACIGEESEPGEES
jgi:hypothetical protein